MTSNEANTRAGQFEKRKTKYLHDFGISNWLFAIFDRVTIRARDGRFNDLGEISKWPLGNKF